jgi:hypothetical protein
MTLLLLSSYSCVCCESPLFVSPLFTDLACFQIVEHCLTDVCGIPVNQLRDAGFCRVGRDRGDGRATRYGLDVKSRWGARFYATAQTESGAHPASCTMGNRSLSRGQSGRSVELTTHPIYRRGQRKSTAIHLLSGWAFMAFFG